MRSLMIAVGSYLLAHSLLGPSVNAQVWQEAVGAVVALIGAVWGFVDKQVGSEALSSATRAAVISVGGILVAMGKLSSDNLSQILGLVGVAGPMLQSYLSKVTAKSIAQGTAKPCVTTGKVEKAGPTLKAMFFAIALVGICGALNAQSPFSAQPKLGARITSSRPGIFHATLIQADSMVDAWRFSIPISPAGYTFAGVYQAAAGLAYGYQRQSYSYATQKYTVLWSASAVLIPIQTGIPIKSVKDVANFGLLFGIKNNVVNIGPFYNPYAPGPTVNGVVQAAKFKDRAGIWLTTTINLNN